MTTNEIKLKIAQLIGKSFHNFGAYKTVDGTELKVEEKMEVGTPIYVITPEGELPAQDGEFELENGMKVKVLEGLIDAIEDKAEEGGVAIDETAVQEEVEMDEATLADGTVVGTDGPFEIGKKLYVKDEAGEWVQAPEGSHSTESGIELVVDAEGVITGLKRPDEGGEGSLEEMMSIFTDALTTLTREINNIREENKTLKENFAKIAGSPAGEKLFNQTGNVMNEYTTSKAERLHAFAEFGKNKRKLNR